MQQDQNRNEHSNEQVKEEEIGEAGGLEIEKVVEENCEDRDEAIDSEKLSV